MKITRRDLGVLLIIAGLLIAFLSYKMSFEGTLEEIDALQTEQQNLKKEINELKPLEAESKKWEDAKKEMAKGIENMMKEFAPDVWQEDNIMSVVDMLENLNVKINSFSASEASVVQTVEGKGSFAGTIYSLARASINMSYDVESYVDLKEYINYVYSIENTKRLIDNISMSFNSESGHVSGSADIVEYVMNDNSRPYEKVELPSDNYGITNENDNSIFGETEEATEEE